MAVSKVTPTVAFFTRFGPLAFRLAAAMLGSEGLAAGVLETVFTHGSPDQISEPELVLKEVHQRCLQTLRSTDIPAASRPVPPLVGVTGESSTTQTDTEEFGLPAATLGDALAELGDDDTALLWNALMGSATESDAGDLAGALRRFDTALSNQHIPGGDTDQWQL